MKIIVGGQIINTKKIYSISEQVLEDICEKQHYFVIESFNDKKLNVTIDFDFRTKEDYPDVSVFNAMSEKEYQKFRLELRATNKNRLEQMRQDVVKIWSENQSDIPIFDPKKY